MSKELMYEILSFKESRERFRVMTDNPASLERHLHMEAGRREEAIKAFFARANADKRLGARLERCPTEELKKHGLLSDFDQVDLRVDPIILNPLKFWPCIIECFWDVRVICKLLWFPGNVGLRPFPPQVVCRICIYRRCRVRCLQPCVRVCVVIVNGATVDLDRDFDTANEVFAQCGIKVVRGPVVTIDAPHLLDLDQPNCFFGHTPTAEENELFGNRGGCTENDIVAYYVRSLSSGARGCAAHPTGLPGFTVANSATKYTMGHELAHVLGLSHVADTTNLMNTSGTANITQHPPNLTDEQCETMKASALVTRC